MIDINKLREYAVKIGNNYPLVSNYMADAADELDRLYEIERRNTPLTREEIEAELVRREIKHVPLSEWQIGLVSITMTDSFIHIVDEDGENDCYKFVTLQLLDAVLEGKSAN